MCDRIVYVDSGSTDGSVAWAKAQGVDVVELDLKLGFTAARARNAGFARLGELASQLEYVQFVDFKGHGEDQPVKAALHSLREHSIFVNVLGSYPEG